MRTVAIALDGVLRKPLDVETQDYGAALLYASLVDNFRIVVLGTDNPLKDEHFLSINGLTNYVKVEPIRAIDGPTIDTQKRKQVQRLRAEGFHFEFVIVPDPLWAKDLLTDGVPVLLYAHPTFSARSFRPGFEHHTGMRPWDDLVAEVDFQRSVLAKQAMDQ